MNYCIKVLCRSIALKNDLSESQVLERAVILLAAVVEPANIEQIDDWPTWYNILANASPYAWKIKAEALHLLDLSAAAYIYEMEGEDDNRNDDL